MIEVKNLSKSYGGLRAVDNLSFSISQGDIVGFLGPNGAGKTTTMKILTGFLAPSAGTVSIAGFDVLSNARDVGRKIG
ncbi:MAG TPA: ATP-binding cassette domain-containing protein, partial [Planctomycetota bacterium]|nr:ATP-binding cassette domain-containing protein [Planctomycetota bacterium]